MNDKDWLIKAKCLLLNLQQRFILKTLISSVLCGIFLYAHLDEIVFKAFDALYFLIMYGLVSLALKEKNLQDLDVKCKN